jgi:hypothetical protein
MEAGKIREDWSVCEVRRPWWKSETKAHREEREDRREGIIR